MDKKIKSKRCLALGVAIGLLTYHMVAPNTAEGNSVLYPNEGRAVIMNGRDYDALLIAYCQLKHGTEHVKAAGCVIQLRKAFPIRGLGYATDSSEAITAETT